MPVIDFYDENKKRDYPLVQGEHLIGDVPVPLDFIVDAGIQISAGSYDGTSAPTLTSLTLAPGQADLTITLGSVQVVVDLLTGYSTDLMAYVRIGSDALLSQLAEGTHMFSSGCELEMSRIFMVVSGVSGVRLYSERPPLSGLNCGTSRGYYTYAATSNGPIRTLDFSAGFNATIEETEDSTTISYVSGAGDGIPCTQPDLVEYVAGAPVIVAGETIDCSGVLTTINKMTPDKSGDLRILAGKNCVVEGDQSTNTVRIRV